MNPNLTEIVFILDRSGSMAGLEADTVGGFNAMVERQKQEDGAALLSAVLFSNSSEVLYDRVDIRRVEPLRPAKTVFVITTDGMENASRRHSYESVQALIRRMREQYGWEFLFLGANIDAISQARRFGISEKRAVRYECDSAGTALNFDVVGKTIGSFRKGEAICDSWCEPIARDYDARGKRK